MGENEGWSDSGGPLPNGLLPGAGPIMMALDTERWLKAEERTAELIACIQPNQLSEERRNAVADYVQRLIMKCFPCQVCTFGSVPLKTYLPDGDIDLTAFSHDQVLKDTWANQVRDMLENEEKNENAEFHVKEVQYIQAEVKIIKCLVENIVVDISFNQVGGLCTLCFLDEVDNLINQNHLFKRSIILIKAWCYYESRILGAHHGLISTYALETLVLYIFHVFNNSFHGPLEVLYRFLEFFSNFDWDSFCVSLWGPVPISSLPDVTAESPRKDSGELLLSKLFLDACSSVYAVFPGGQENNGQPFVSKHFNVVDPLRVNNNLGRSVSKGNSFRIRSAFAFGAKRLARLLECPKENLVYEVNQFFMNTWERHGSGHRPDAPGTDSWRLKLSNSDGFRDFDKSKNILSGKRINENSFLETEMQGNARGISHENYKTSSSVIPSEFSAASHTQNIKSQFNLNSIQGTDRIGRNPSLDQAEVNTKAQKDLNANNLINDNQGRFLFARTRSSPELTDAYGDVPSEVRHSVQAETANPHSPSVRLDNSSRRKNLGSESLARPKSHSSNDDTPSMRHVAAQPTLDNTADSNSISHSHNQDIGLDSLSEDFSSTSTAQLMHQEEQDIVNMMASASLQGFNGQVHLPLNLSSPHVPFQIPPSFLASMGYTQRNMPGFTPTNFPFMDPSFANMQFAHGLVSPQVTPYFPGVELSLPSEDSVEQRIENFGSVEINSRENNNDSWHEQDIGSSVNYEYESRNFDAIQSDNKPPEIASGLKYIPPFRLSGATRGQSKHARGKRGSVLENSDTFSNQDTRNSEVYAEERSVSSRFSSATHSNSLRSRTSSESSWDGSSVKTPKSTKEKQGKKVFSIDQSANHGKGKNMSEHVSNQAEDDDQEWGTMINLESEIVERNPGSEQDTSLQIPRHHLTGLEVAQTSGSDSMMPFAPMLIGNGVSQGINDNSGLITFYPTGPPIPFLTMLPLYNIPPENGTSDASSGHFGGDETLGQSESGQNCVSEEFDHVEDFNSCSSLRGATIADTSDEQKSDILNSDFASHWQNLQVGRFCQNPRYHVPLVYPSPMMVPPVYLQGQFPYDNTGRTHSTNTNIFSQLMTSYGHRLVPIAPVHSVSNRPPHVYQRYMDDMPRYRGTGTYLPNPKLSVRDRHSSSSTRRGNYNHDRNDNYGDGEGNWNANSKSRAATRNHNRSQADKSNTRTGRLAPSENRTERSWNAYRHELNPSYQSQNGPSHSNSSQNGAQSVAYSMHAMTATNPNGVSNGPSVPPMVMLYPFDHNAGYSSHVEPLEFGSLGPVAFPGVNDQLQLNDRSRARMDNRLNGGPEHRSSPDQPSSPHHHRYCHEPKSSYVESVRIFRDQWSMPRLNVPLCFPVEPAVSHFVCFGQE
ncbi:hypothetical protein F511_05584 [Dorcoceras hygrometricum]|uniref:Polymerase nucleotidyl transferase domain-containing protein n=1 Tax=Dorcoceras hygrometricum TaxID=472368 RepID=A0A2Z7AJF0_9LAMI|nr:hypothetical protein F511_05584 [Dorcoceras hygrometricum]